MLSVPQARSTLLCNQFAEFWPRRLHTANKTLFMKGGWYVPAHIAYPNCSRSRGDFLSDQLECIHGTDNVVGDFWQRGSAPRAHFARRYWFAHVAISTVRGLFAVRDS